MTLSCLELSPSTETVRTKERREAPRFSCRLHALCRLANRPRSPLFEGTVVNVSAYGAAVLVSQELSRGAEVSMRLFNSAGAAQCDRVGRVIHARPVSGGWIMGCQFDKYLERAAVATLLGLPPLKG